MILTFRLNESPGLGTLEVSIGYDFGSAAERLRSTKHSTGPRVRGHFCLNQVSVSSSGMCAVKWTPLSRQISDSNFEKK